MGLPGDLGTVILTGEFLDPAGNPMRGTVTIQPNATLLDATGNVIVSQIPRAYQLFNGSFRTAPLVGTDNTDINPSGWTYLITIALQEVPSYSFNVALPSSGSPVDLSTLSPAQSIPELAGSLPVTGGTLTGKLTLTGSTPLQIPAGAAAGDVLTSDASGNASWSSVSADGIATASALAAETSRAETAEAAKLPLTGGTVSGTLSLTGTSPLQITHGAASGDVLTSDSSGNAAWGPAAASALTPAAVVNHAASPYSAAATQLVPVDTTSGNVTVTLPNAPANLTVVGVKHVIQGGTNTVTVACAGSDVLNKTGGGTSLTLTLLNQGVLLQYKASGGIWYVTGDDVPLTQTDTRYLTVFNVKNYGAKGDGSTDDTAAWTAALAAAVAAGTAARGNGGMVLFPPGGHYMVSELDFSSAATANVAVHVVADGAIIEHNASGGGVFVNFAGIPSTATLLDSSFTGATLYPKQSATNPTTDLIYMTAAFRNKLDVRVFDPGLFASSSGSALHMYGRAGQGIYYSEISLRVTPGPGYTNSYGGTVFTIDGQDGLGGGSYIQSNRFPVLFGHHSLGTGFNDLGSGENLYQLVDMEYNAGYGLVMSQYSFGVRFEHFYFEGNNSSGDQWSLPLSSTNGASNRFTGSLATSPSAAEVAWWGFYTDCAYLESGGSDQSMFSPILQAGLQTNGWHYPKVYGATNQALLGMKVQGDAHDRVNFAIDSAGQPALSMGIGSAVTDTVLERIAAGRWGPGSNVVWQAYGGEAHRTTPLTYSATPYNIQKFDREIFCDATSGAFTVRLNSGQGIPGEMHTISKIDTSGNAITVGIVSGSYTIAGASTYSLSSQWQSATFVCDADFNWIIAATSSSGGSGMSNPMTTLGDLIYENGTPAATRLAGNTTSTKNFLTQTGTGSVSAAPGWGTIAAGDLPTGTTSAKGALQLDGTAADILPPGTQAAGANGLAADSGHAHATNLPAIATDYTVSSTALKAWNYDVMFANTSPSGSSSSFANAGTVYLARINIRQAITPTKIVIWNNAPTGGSPTGYYLALFNSSGTQLGSTSSDQTASSGGMLAISVGTPGALSAGTYVYAALLVSTQGSTKGGATYFPLIGAAANQFSAGTVAAYRFAANLTGQSSMPGSLTLSSNTSSLYAFWCALQ